MKISDLIIEYPYISEWENDICHFKKERDRLTIPIL